MAIKKSSFLILFAVLFFAGSLFLLYSQDTQATASSYFIDPQSDPNEPRFIQRLVWSGGDYALFYEVIIEILSDNTFRSHLQRNTNDHHIDISLSPGEYRFRVIPYDILERPGQPSEWIEFEILSALRPVIDEIFGIWDHQNNVIIIHGSDISPGAEIVIRGEDDNYLIPDSIEILDDGNIQLIFDSHVLPMHEEEYEITVRNPGGLEARIGGINLDQLETAADLLTQVEPEVLIESENETEIEIETEIETELETETEIEAGIEDEETDEVRQRSVIFNLGVSFQPLLHIYGDNIGSNNFPGSIALNYTLLFPSNTIYIGFEFLMIYNFDYFYDDFLSLGINSIFRKTLFDNSAGFNLRIGAEFFPVLEESLFSLNMGLSFYKQITGWLYIETGFIFSSFFAGSGNNFESGMIRPMFSIGIKN